VNDLRTLSLAETGQLSLNPIWISPLNLLEQVQDTYKVVAEKQGVTLTRLNNTGLPEIKADPDRIMQVLTNLVNNALRHTPAGGTIILQSEISRLPFSENFPWSAAEDHPKTETWLTISVIDSGDGIQPEVIDHIFDRFYRGDPAREDGAGQSGLGLAIARSIIDLHAGHITADSEGPGKGSTFTIYLPVNHPSSH
jgi:signal transduction histidine kinase